MVLDHLFTAQPAPVQLVGFFVEPRPVGDSLCAHIFIDMLVDNIPRRVFGRRAVYFCHNSLDSPVKEKTKQRDSRNHNNPNHSIHPQVSNSCIH